MSTDERTTYVVDSIGNVFCGMSVAKGETIGKLGEVQVLSEISGIVASVEKVDVKYEVSIIDTKDIIVEAIIPYSNLEDLQKNKIKVDFSIDEISSYSDLKFIGIDYEYGIIKGEIIALFSFVSEDVDIYNGISGKVRLKTGISKDCFTIDKDAFSDYDKSINAKTFLYMKKVNDEEVFLKRTITLQEFYGEYAIIQGSDLTVGTVLYLK